MTKTDFDKLWTELSTTAEYCGVGVGVVTKDDAQRIYDAGVQAERERCVKLIPTTWLDPLLTGENKVVSEPPFDCSDIERLLKALATKLKEQP